MKGSRLTVDLRQEEFNGLQHRVNRFCEFVGSNELNKAERAAVHQVVFDKYDVDLSYDAKPLAYTDELAAAIQKQHGGDNDPFIPFFYNILESLSKDHKLNEHEADAFMLTKRNQGEVMQAIQLETEAKLERAHKQPKTSRFNNERVNRVNRAGVPGGLPKTPRKKLPDSVDASPTRVPPVPIPDQNPNFWDDFLNKYTSVPAPAAAAPVQTTTYYYPATSGISISITSTSTATAGGGYAVPEPYYVQQPVAYQPLPPRQYAFPAGPAPVPPAAAEPPYTANIAQREAVSAILDESLTQQLRVRFREQPDFRQALIQRFDATKIRYNANNYKFADEQRFREYKTLDSIDGEYYLLPYYFSDMNMNILNQKDKGNNIVTSTLYYGDGTPATAVTLEMDRDKLGVLNEVIRSALAPGDVRNQAPAELKKLPRKLAETVTRASANDHLYPAYSKKEKKGELLGLEAGATKIHVSFREKVLREREGEMKAAVMAPQHFA